MCGWPVRRLTLWMQCCQLVQHPEHPDLRYQLQLQLGAWLILQRYGLCCRICGHPHGHTHVHQWGHERSPDRMRGSWQLRPPQQPGLRQQLPD